ncbi:MAG TPA: DNA alkylation repair protein [Acidobacteriota bacterium]|nr:DNA alkylation repair protein [Acidobacteriota bacterium]
MTATEALAWLKKNGTKRTVDGMARYGITAPHAFGVTMGAMLGLSKRVGTDHALARNLWKSGWYEARMLATMVADPARLTRAQMNAWTASFDNWGICDTACFKLYDRSPHAWSCAAAWAKSPKEFVKRAGFALMACLALHDKAAPDAKFLPYLPLIEKGALDERNFVMKGVSWALRSIGRRSPGLHAASQKVAERLAARAEAAARWVGKDALRELSSPKVRAAVARRAESAGSAKARASAGGSAGSSGRRVPSSSR